MRSPEPAQTTEPSEEDDETALLQREVDSALSCLDLDLDEALAESAAFTESSSLQTQSRLPPTETETSETETETETSQETEAETLPVVVRETAKAAPETPEPEQPQRTVLTSRQTVQETREVIETLLPVARVTESEAVPSPTLPSATVRTQSEEVITVTERQMTAPSTETTREPAAPQPTQTARAAERTEQRVESVAAKRRTPKLGATSRQHPVEVEEEVVVERVEKVQRNRMTPKDIKLHIERKLASFDQSPRSPSQPSQLISPPTSAPAAGGADSPDWQYRLPEPPTPFQDPTTAAGRTAPLEAPLEFQDNMTVTSSEPSEAGELAEATNAPLVERVGRSDPARSTADQSEAALASGSQSDATPTSRDQWDGGRSERPAKPERRRSSERLARQMSFSIGAYSQREPTGTEGGGSAGRPQRADSFHCQKTSAVSASQVTSGADSAAEPGGPEMTARRPVSRRRSSDAAAGSRGQRSAETDRPAAAEPVRPPRKYEVRLQWTELKFNSSKSYSMLNLSNGGLTMPAERPSPNMNKTQSQTDLAMESEVSDIQSEFLKLQRQFLHWQQQLLQNQSILQTKVAPLAARPSAAASLQSLEVIEELRRRVPEQEDSPDPPADYSGRSQSLPRGSSLQHPKLSLAAEQRRSEPEPQPEPERERSTAWTREQERTPPRQRASTLERRQESEPEPTRQRASTLERRPSETRAEKRVPWSPPKVALGTWAEQSRQSQVQLKEDRDYVLRQGPPPQSQQAAPEPTSEQAARRPAAVSVRPSKSVTVTSLGAPPPPVGVPLPQTAPQPVNGQQRLSAVAKVRHNESVPAPTAVLSSAVRGPSTRQPPAFSISDSKPSQPGRGVAAAAAAGRFTSVVSLTEEPRQPLSVSVQVSKTAARVGAATTAARPAESTTVTCRVSPPDQTAAQPRTVPSVVSVTRKDSATSTELSARQTASEVSRRSRNQPVVKGFRQPEVPAPVPPPPPPPAPVLPPASEAAAGRARLKPVSAGRPVVPKLDPREELMIAIREHGGLKKRGGVRP
ncbi:hypothetical protein FJT64_019383 [Amphibalanus amphitrite]|uniref:WH2 domain-containing protein n=1 Tax=Amphibalanus amphitrite TaxID=1232801 RepID=A0A6A4X0E9_AMPAM|nr:hypothetical protein FJT64_019383 [Amphibalanus amphitrite]